MATSTVKSKKLDIDNDKQEEIPVESIPNPDPETPEMQPEEPIFPEEDDKPATSTRPDKPAWNIYPPQRYSINDIISFKSGQVYNNLTLISKNEENNTWSCKCVCGNIIDVPEKRLNGSIQSCGCKERHIKKFNPYLRWIINLD